MSRALMNKLLIAYRRNVFLESLRCCVCGDEMIPMPKQAEDDSFYLTNRELWLDLSSSRKRSPCRKCMIMASRTSGNKRRVGIASSETHFTRDDVIGKYDDQKGKCVYCGIDLFISKYHIDHIYPLARGGTNGPENIQLLCPTCNVSKGTKTHDEFMQYRLTKKKLNGKKSITCS